MIKSDYQDQIEAIIENTPNVAVQGFDENGRITFWNSASTELYGYQAKDAHGKRLLDLGFWTVEEEEEYRQMIQGILASGKPAPMREWLIRTVGGEEKVILSTLFPIRFGQDRTEVVCMDVDITKRKRAEQALRDSEERAHDLAERLKILLRELDHRVKNNLTSLHALIDLYAKSSLDVLAFAKAMHGKLDAMSWAHELTTSDEGSPLMMASLLKYLARIHEQPEQADDGLHLDGSELILPARQVAPLAMVFEELFSNATKHGNWKERDGQIVIRWNILDSSAEGTKVQIDWTEPTEQPLHSPSSRGVGLGLIEAFTRFELCGHARFYFDETGFTCKLECRFDSEA